MNQFSIQFEHPLVDAAFVLPNQSEDADRASLLPNAQSESTEESPEELSLPLQQESEEANSHKQLAQTVDLVAGQLAKIQTERSKLREELVARFDLIAVQVAEFVFREDPELAVSRLRSCLAIALETLDQDCEFVVSVHPSQMSAVSESLEELAHGDCLNIRPDEQIGVGDCRVEQNNQGLYASLEDQLARVAVQIHEQFDRERQAS